MAFSPPIPLIRRNVIIKRLKETGACLSETAKILAEAGVINPNAFFTYYGKAGRAKSYP